jgi:hypothetical protein
MESDATSNSNESKGTSGIEPNNVTRKPKKREKSIYKGGS